MDMTETEMQAVNRLHRQGLGYKRIAAQTGVPLNSVKSYLRRRAQKMIVETACETCGKSIMQMEHRKLKRFCSDQCRMAWWSAHSYQIKRKTEYTHKCLWCGKVFQSSRATSLYCGRKCYADARRKGSGGCG